MSWLPDDFVHPVRIPVPGTALHLRPIREADTALDYPAVMGSRERLREIFGPAWDWPKDTMTLEEDRLDLLRHEEEIAAHQSFNYALLDEQENGDPRMRLHRPARARRLRRRGLLVGGGRPRRRRGGARAGRSGAAVDRCRLAVSAAPLSEPRHHLAGLARPAGRLVTSEETAIY
jgi:hypothetical protein